MRVKELLREKLSSNELKFVPSSFDIVGSRSGAVAIVEFPPDSPDHVKRAVAEAIMAIHKNVRTVLAKRSERRGVYRLREYEVLAGSGETEVVHKEHGVLMKVDPTKVYFSPREATERMRIARQVKPGEFVMVMFAGVGPYALAIAKTQPLVRRIVAIEINPEAYRYMVENIELNKLQDKIVPVLGDVRHEAARWYGMCDRVVMPLPRGAYKFLNEAVRSLRPRGGVIHFYHWSREGELFVEALYLVEREALVHGMYARVLDARVVSPYAPRTYKVCIDTLIEPL